MIDELKALDYIKRKFSKCSEGVLIGPGDDCAVIERSEGKLLLATTDTLVEGTHFIRSWMSPVTLGFKAVSVSISDIAAMGGYPLFFLSTVGVPGDIEKDYFEGIFEGLKEASIEYDVDLVGGNLASSDKLFIDIAFIGEVEKDLLITRRGATPGDVIFVTGTVGDSGAGLSILQKYDTPPKDSYLVKRHITPTPRLQVAREIARLSLATSMIDVSDGVLIDLERITVAFGLGAEIYIEKIPLSDDCIRECRRLNLPVYEIALTTGEDYELLFTASQSDIQKIKEVSEKTGVAITPIGRVTSSGSVSVFSKDGKKMEFKNRGFIHFKS